jgi:hypothetical protein
MRQPPIDRDARPEPASAPAGSGRSASDHGQAVVLVRRAEDGVEVEVGPVTGGRHDRWSRAETFIGLLVIVVLAGGIVINGLSGPPPDSSHKVAEASASSSPTPGPSVRGTPRPTAIATPNVTPAAPCGVLDRAGLPPGVSLVVEGGNAVPGTPGRYDWYGTAQPGGLISLGDAVDVPFEGEVEFIIAGDVCATQWVIEASSFNPPGTFSDQAIENGDLWNWARFQANHGDNPVISQQNRIVANTLGIGLAVVRGSFWFADGGTMRLYWRVRIAGFPTPDVRVVADDGSSVQPVVGCGRSYNTPEQYFGEQCEGTSRPALLDGPVLTVRNGSIIDVDVAGWAVTYWSAGWADQAAVVAGGAAGGDDRGSYSGYDADGLHRLRWLAPPVGEWNVQLWMNSDHDGFSYQIPFYLRVRVV